MLSAHVNPKFSCFGIIDTLQYDIHTQLLLSRGEGEVLSRKIWAHFWKLWKDHGIKSSRPKDDSQRFVCLQLVWPSALALSAAGTLQQWALDSAYPQIQGCILVDILVFLVKVTISVFSLFFGQTHLASPGKVAASAKKWEFGCFGFLQ